MSGKKYMGFVISLVIVSALMTGCAGRAPSDAGSLDASAGIKESGVDAGENTDNGSSKGISEQADLSFPIGQPVNFPRAFTGTAYISSIITYDDVYHFPQTNHITFEPGARSDWHTHGGMIILVTGGTGYYQEEGKPAQIIRKGDVLECPEGVRHWHGAAPDSWFSQMVIFDSQYRDSGENGGNSPVTDEAYANLEAKEYEGRNVDADSPFMFRQGTNPTIMGTFSGPVYLSTIAEADNVAGAPGLHYVVFEPGVINNWHIHEGGQILIATDGIGYHQIEGEPVQVMRPGDVAFCPPGIRHWHGGSVDSSFAHIAVNTNPELSGVEWFDRISDEEYEQLTLEIENQAE